MESFYGVRSFWALWRKGNCKYAKVSLRAALPACLMPAASRAKSVSWSPGCPKSKTWLLASDTKETLAALREHVVLLLSFWKYDCGKDLQQLRIH